MAFKMQTTPGRSRNMAAIRSTNTVPELLLARTLWAAGLRDYHKHVKLPGRPDLVFPGPRVAVFVDGCFWHGCPEHGRMTTASNNAYWTEKMARRVAKDACDTAELKRMGYRVLRFWEHEVRRDVEKVTEDVWMAVKFADGVPSDVPPELRLALDGGPEGSSAPTL